VLWAVLASSAWTTLTPVAAPVSPMSGIRTLVGLCQVPYLSRAAMLVGRWIPLEERGRAQALTRSASNLAPAIFAPLAAALVHAIGSPSPFYLFGLLGGVWAIAWLIMVRVPRGAVRATTRCGHPAPRAPEHGMRAIGTLLRGRSTWSVVLSYFAVPYATFMLLGWLPTLFAERFPLSLVGAGVLTTPPFLGGFLAQLPSGAVLDRLTVRGWGTSAAHKLLIGAGDFGSALFTLLAMAHFQVGWVLAA
jgi:MFS family permease